MDELHYKTDQETINKIFSSLLIEILANQHIILKRIAEDDAIGMGCSVDDILKQQDDARDIGRQIVKEHLFEAYGPDLTDELGL